MIDDKESRESDLKNDGQIDQSGMGPIECPSTDSEPRTRGAELAEKGVKPSPAPALRGTQETEN